MGATVIPFRQASLKRPSGPIRRGRRRELEMCVLMLKANLKMAHKATDVTLQMLQDAEARLAEIEALAR